MGILREVKENPPTPEPTNGKVRVTVSFDITELASVICALEEYATKGARRALLRIATDNHEFDQQILNVLNGMEEPGE